MFDIRFQFDIFFRVNMDAFGSGRFVNDLYAGIVRACCFVSLHRFPKCYRFKINSIMRSIYTNLAF